MKVKWGKEQEEQITYEQCEQMDIQATGDKEPLHYIRNNIRNIFLSVKKM